MGHVYVHVFVLIHSESSSQPSGTAPGQHEQLPLLWQLAVKAAVSNESMTSENITVTKTIASENLPLFIALYSKACLITFTYVMPLKENAFIPPGPFLSYEKRGLPLDRLRRPRDGD